MTTEIRVLSRCHTHDGPDWQPEREPLAVTLARVGGGPVVVDLEPFKAYFLDVKNNPQLKAPIAQRVRSMFHAIIPWQRQQERARA